MLPILYFHFTHNIADRASVQELGLSSRAGANRASSMADNASLPRMEAYFTISLNNIVDISDDIAYIVLQPATWRRFPSEKADLWRNTTSIAIGWYWNLQEREPRSC
jgi:hypothetical protein